MKTIEEWKKTIDEVAELKDNFLRIKKDSEELIVKAREIAVSGIEDAKELVSLSKNSFNTILTTVLGQGDLKSKVKAVSKMVSGEESDSDDDTDLKTSASKLMSQKRSTKTSKNLNSQN